MRLRTTMSSDSTATVRLRVTYEGRVQGVGFRWMTTRIARHFSVSGTVRNLADGTVELIAQGARAEVTDFLAEIADQMQGYIERSNTEELPVQADLSGFRIAR